MKAVLSKDQESFQFWDYVISWQDLQCHCTAPIVASFSTWNKLIYPWYVNITPCQETSAVAFSQTWVTAVCLTTWRLCAQCPVQLQSPEAAFCLQHEDVSSLFEIQMTKSHVQPKTVRLQNDNSEILHFPFPAWWMEPSGYFLASLCFG